MTTLIATLLLSALLAPQTTTKAAAERTKEDEAKARREHAILVLTGLAEESEKFSSATLRARVQARAADLLWTADRPRAVALFRQAWESSEAAYLEEKRRHDEEMRRQGENGASVSWGFVDVREEVLRLAAGRDRSLGDELFEKLAESREREAESARPENRPASPSEALLTPPDAVAKRLGLAGDLLARGDVEAALRFADPALGAVTMPGVEFLTKLRAKDLQAADARYARLLATAAADPSSDANTVSVLAAYVVSPHVYYVIDPAGGGSSMSMQREQGEPEPSAGSRAAFLQAAAQILLRPMTPEQVDATTAGRLGTYLLIGRLLPHYERHAGHLVEQLRARQTALGLDANEMARRGERTFGSSPPEMTKEERADRVDELLDEARRARSAEARDAAYAQAAIAALRADEDRVDGIVGSISDLELRAKVRGWVDFLRAGDALSEGNLDRLLRVVRRGELTPFHRAWFLTAAARRLAKGDKERAASLLDEALEEARRVSLADPDRPRAIFGVATSWIDVDPKHVRERAAEAVDAANKAEGFTGEDGAFRLTIAVYGSVYSQSESAPHLDVAPLFAHLARVDMADATQLAQSLSGEGPRAAALLAVARATLDAQRPRAR